MNSDHPWKLAVVVALAVLSQSNLFAADHGHLNAGAVGTHQNDKLIFDNAADYASSSGYVKTLTYTNGGTYAGYYQGNVTLAAWAQTSLNGGPAPHASAPGSFIQAQIAAVEGPPDGAFAFWEIGATNPTISLVSGQLSTNIWRLSESDGSLGSDPYGHIHGRRFTASVPGIYQVGFRLLDTSTNGVGSGPIHTPSDILTVFFQAGVNILSIEPDEDHSHIRFSAPLGNNWQLEAANAVSAQSKWDPVGDSVTGDDYFHEIEDDHPVVGTRYYRIKGIAP